MPKLSSSSFILILGNLIPIAGVLFFNWQLYPLILIYWLENAVIGVFVILKLLSCAELESIVKKLFISAFFTVHYGMFWYGHGTFVVSLFGEDSHEVSQALQLVAEYGLQIAFLALVISHGISFFINYLGKGEFKRLSLDKIMFSPYKRVVVLHVFIIFGGMALQTFGVTQTGLVLLAIIKIIADLMAHKMEHKNA